MDLYLARDGATALSWARGGGRARFLCLNWEALEALSSQGLPAQAWEDLLTPASDRALREKTIALADSWHLHRGRDFTVFDGLSMGRALRWQVWFITLRTAYKFAAGLTLALDQERPAAVYCESGAPEIYREVLEAVAAARGNLRVETIGSSRSAPGNCTGVDIFRYSPPPLTLPPRKRWACLAANALGGAWSALSGNGKGRPTALVSYYHSLESLLELAAEPGHPFQYRFIDIPPKRLAPALAKAGSSILLSARTPPVWPAADEAALAGIEHAWSEARADPVFRSRFDWEGAPLWPAIEPGLREHFASNLRPLAWASRALSAAWRRDPPRLVLLPYDGPPLQHLMTDLARLHKTPAALLCHGLPATYDFMMENQNPSHLLVWGKGTADRWEGSDGGRGRRLVVIGNPAFDRYARRPRPSPCAFSPIHKVLVLSHPLVFLSFLASDADPERYAAAALTGLQEPGVFRVSVKLHLSESMSFYKRCFSARFPEARFIQNRPMERCLLENDLVIGSFSTVLLEAMILGKPILCFNPSRTEFAPPFDGNWGLPLIRDAAGLKAALAGISRDPDGFRRATWAAYPRILEAFAGPTDGTATRKVLAGLASIAAMKGRA